MADRPLSLFEQFTKTVLPPAEVRARTYLVCGGANALGAAIEAYNLQTYSPDLWRNMLIANGITNPFAFDLDPSVSPEGQQGQRIIVPAIPLPDFV